MSLFMHQAVRPALQWLSHRRLSTRIVAIFLSLLLAVQAVGFVLLRSTIEAKERRGISEDLAVGSRALSSLLQRNADRLASGARVAARDHGFATAEKLGGVDAIADALTNNLDRLCEAGNATAASRAEARRCREGSAAALFDTEFQLRVSTREDLPDLSALARQMAASQTRAAGPGTGVETLGNGAVVMVGDRLMQFVVVPRRNPLITGWVLMGFALDQKLATDLRGISGLHLAVLARPDARQAWRSPIHTLDEAANSALLDGLGRTQPGATLFAGAEEFSTLVLPLSLHAGSEPGQAGQAAPNAETGNGQAVAVLLLSVDAALAAFRELQRWLLLITVAAVLLFAVGSVVTARRITTPLRALARASERLGQGRFDEPVPIPAQNDEVGELAHAVEHMRLNIREQQTEIRELAYGDRLTGLPNRASFRAELSAAIRQVDAHGGVFSVVMLGLSRFKVINENLGYAFGDRVLRAVAERLKGHVKREDLIARLSGDHFAILLRGAEASRALSVADGITAAFVNPLVFPDQTVDVSATFGVACWPAHAPEGGADSSVEARAELLLARAEVAMYSAKEKATHALCYDPSIDASSAQTLTLLSELRQAIAANELRLFLQPKIDLATRQIIGAEALVRWQHPTRGMVPPIDFIPFAEDTGFVRQLTLWIFEETARQWPVLSALGLQRVSVNLSTRDLLDPDLPTRFDAILRRQGVPATAFCLEITESAIMSEPKRSLAMLDTLAAAGFKLSIDDYGEGQTSLSYLKRLPVHELKIDQIFIRRIDQDVKDAKIVRSTIGLAHSLGFRVVAEGVESGAVLDLLQELNCDEAQGFHMSRPVPAQELPALISAWMARAQPEAAVAA